MTHDWRIDFLGDSAVVLRPPDEDVLQANDRVHVLSECLRRARLPGVRDIVPGMRDLVVHVDALRCDFAALAQVVAASRAADASMGTAGVLGSRSTVVEVPVSYGGEDGPDLGDVARTCGLAMDEVCRRHAAIEYRVCFVGFLPGFPYLGPVDPALRLPRRTTPRPRVPAGSVAIAGEYAGIYPWASPGGWHLIGRTDLPMFDLAHDPPALLQPGMRVRFVPA